MFSVIISAAHLDYLVFSGGSFSNFTIFALSITPYVTASIILQLLTVAIPRLEALSKEGTEGRKKIAQYTRYLTVVLAFVQSIGLTFGLFRSAVIDNSFFSLMVIVLTLTAGTAFLMWLGEQINEYGIGNGISLIIMAGIVARMPSAIHQTFAKMQTGEVSVVSVIIFLVFAIAVIVGIIEVQQGTRKIPVQYAKSVRGRRTVGGQSSSIPLKVNTAGVIPVIFASSILSIPAIIVNLFGIKSSGVGAKILSALSQSNWFNKANWWPTLGLLAYVLLVFFFAYFYTAITFNPMEIANNMKKGGGFIPGIRPGKPTQDYLNKILNYIIFIGAVGLLIVAVIPMFFNGYFGMTFSFGGTSIIIVVGVVIETMKGLESQMLPRHYQGFLLDK